MILVGILEQLELANILQEIHPKTGLLTIKHGEQRVKLYLKQGLIMCIDSHQGHTTLENGHAHSNGHAHIEDNSQNELQEATRIIQDLLTWSTGEVYFEDEVQSPTDRSPLALHISSLVPSLLSLASTPILSTRDPQALVEAKDGFITPLPPVEKDDITIKLPTLAGHLSNTTPIVEAKDGLITPLPAVEEDDFPTELPTPVGNFSNTTPVVEEDDGPITLLPAIADTPTLVQQTVILPGRADTFLPDAVTAEIPIFKPGQRQFAGLRWEVLLIVAVLLVAALAHGINMFHFPYLEDDEGTYMSQAWAVVHEGRLGYYTYWYDHAPAGWLLIAAWSLITGGFHSLGPAIYSGRVLMLLLQLCSTFMLYCIARKISRNVTVAVIVSLLFALSPYGIYFHRRILLDNITTFWMLLSILLLLSERLSLKRIWLSAVALSLSILSKELTVFLVPVLTYLVFVRADKSHRWFATIGWIALVGCLVSLYLLMATLNNELFPTGTLLGGTSQHVSLLGTLQYQASRGRDGGLFSLHSGFWMRVQVWVQDDPVLVVIGSLCAGLSVLAIKKHRLIGLMGVVTLSIWAFLARGGEIINFYLVPLIPLLALNVGLFLGLIAETLRPLVEAIAGKRSKVSQIVEHSLIILCLVGIVFSSPGPSMGAGYGSSDLGDRNNPFLFWNGTQADAQIQATQWIENNLPPSSRMIIDMSMWTDLYDSDYKFVHYYWKVELDPAIRDTLFHDDWRNFDYVATTPQMLTDMQREHMKLVQAVVFHSTPIAHFDTGGWRVEIRKVNKPNHVFSFPSNQYLLSYVVTTDRIAYDMEKTI